MAGYLRPQTQDSAKGSHMKTRAVALHGSSLVMSAIGATLRDNPRFQVQTLKGSLPELLDDLPPPTAILFDLAASSPPTFAIPLLQKHPAIVLIGVDLTTSRMLVVSGEHSRLLTMDDLVQVIDASPAPVNEMVNDSVVAVNSSEPPSI